MKKILGYLAVCISLIGIAQEASAQHKEEDILFFQSVTTSVLSSAYLPKGRILSGAEYTSLNYNPSKGHPFFLNSYFTSANIVYEGLEYTNIPLLYDLVQDQVVIGDVNRPNLMVVLDKAKISQFQVQGHLFVYVQPSESTNTLFKAGHLESLNNGEVKVLVQRTKTPSGRESETNVIITFKEKNTYFLLKDNTYYPIRSKKDAFKVLADRKRELQQFVKQENGSFSKNPEKWLVNVSEFYNSQAN